MDHDEMTLVLLGATGDLTRRLLFPAIYRLYAAGKWTPTAIIGFAKEDWSHEKFLTHIHDNLKVFVEDFSEEIWAKLKASIGYQSGDLTPQSLAQIAPKISGAAVFYLGLPPQLFGPAAEALGRAGLNRGQGWRRLVIEKPFGWDLSSAEALTKTIGPWWDEDQIFRIDHFLGKDTAQNILVFRFVNRILGSIWDRNHIRQVQITYAETLGVEGRWQYYDRAGALRDMLQNHLLQLFTLMAMEPPGDWDATDLHNHKAEVLRSVRRVSADQLEDFAVAGQYSAGNLGGQPVLGYTQEEGIPTESTTETFAAIKLYVDNWRWHGVPFYLRSGKRMARDWAEIAVEMEPVPDNMFGAGSADWLIFRIKPDEAIDLALWAKRPGLGLETESVVLTAPYKKAGEIEYSAYEQLLLDVIVGDHSAFPRFDEVEEAWRIVDPILTAWTGTKPEAYAAGSEGPAAQDRLMDPGLAWRNLGPQG